MVSRVMLSTRSWCTLNNMSVPDTLPLKSISLLMKLVLVVLAVNTLPVKTSNGKTESSIEELLENNDMNPEHQFETSSKEDHDRMKLVQLDPIKVGFIRQMELEPGRIFEVETVAMKPPIFLIHNFLTSEECDEIKNCALAAGLHSSKILTRRPFKEESVNKVEDPYYNNDTFIKFDEDNDNVLNITEAGNALSIIKGVTSLPRDVFKFILKKFIDVDSNGHIDDLEFRDITSWVTSIREWIDKYERNMTDPEDILKMKKGRSRVSQQAWIEHSSYDPNGNIATRTVSHYFNRLITLTGLHPDIIHASESLQVVYYTPGGHYHAHHDSSVLNLRKSCEHTRALGLYPETEPKAHLGKTRLCRFITILYYLENTEEGGETAFPAADNETYSRQVYEKDNGSIDPMDLKNHCHDANLVLKPKKGLAVMWYNHYIEPENEWIGERDLFSLHGGCDVIKGEKWIANNWITIDSNYEKQIEFHKQVLKKFKKSQNRDSGEKAPISEQDSNENYLPLADRNLENEENGASHFIADQEDIANQENKIRNEL